MELFCLLLFLTLLDQHITFFPSKSYHTRFCKMLYINTIFRPEDYKMIDSNPEAEDNKENVDLKEEEIASKFLKSIHMFVIEDLGFLVRLCVEQHSIMRQRNSVFSNTAVRMSYLTCL